MSQKPASRFSRIAEFALILVAAYLLSEVATSFLFPKKTEVPTGVTIAMEKASVRMGNPPVLIVTNNTKDILVAPDMCPMPPLNVYLLPAEGAAGSGRQIGTDQVAGTCTPIPAIPAGGNVHYSLAPWKYTLFNTPGRFELKLPLELPPEVASGSVLTTHFTQYEPGSFVKLFRGTVTKPLLFVLVSIASVLPGHSLGWAIIILTLIVKLALFFPTQHALEGQRKMQALQPKLDELKKKYGKDPKRMHEETMKLWQENKVNPFQSCLPMLVQFPVLIGLFFVIRDSSVIETSREFLYPIHQNLEWTFGNNFLGLNLMLPHALIFVPLLVVLQFIQMKLTMTFAKRKQQAKASSDTQSAMEMQQKIMLYVLPAMIGFFALRFPSAVSLYWLVSTVFAIGQQIVVNRKVG